MRPLVSSDQPMRADARENYERILDAATSAIERDGNDASLTAIAAEAGVGIGTLYRRFPTRDHLIEAVYRSKVLNLCDAADDILNRSPDPVVALRVWSEKFIALLIARHGIAAAIKPSLSHDSAARTVTSQSLTEAVRTFLTAGCAARALRGDVDPIDLVRTLTGIAFVSASVDDANRVLAVVFDGLSFSHDPTNAGTPSDEGEPDRLEVHVRRR